jgi:hypothetical protein
MQQVSITDRYHLKNYAFHGPTALIRLAARESLLGYVTDTNHVVSELIQVGAPNLQAIKGFLLLNKDVPYVCIYEATGLVTNASIAAAWMQYLGQNNSPIISLAAYDRKLYADMLETLGLDRPVEKLASIVVPVHPRRPDNLEGFICSMRSQRHTRWELLAVTEGRDDAAYNVVAAMRESRVRLIQGPAMKGDYGNCYRQIGFDCISPASKFVNTNNDDTYLTPGFLEQLIQVLEWSGRDAAQCDVVHSYGGYQTTIKNENFGNGHEAWLIRSQLIRSVPWDDYTIDGEETWLKKIMVACQNNIVYLPRPLVVHN